MEGKEAFLIFVFLSTIRIFKYVNAHLVNFPDSMKPERLLLGLCSALFIADLDNISYQTIKLQDKKIV